MLLWTMRRSPSMSKMNFFNSHSSQSDRRPRGTSFRRFTSLKPYKLIRNVSRRWHAIMVDHTYRTLKRTLPCTAFTRFTSFTDARRIVICTFFLRLVQIRGETGVKRGANEWTTFRNRLDAAALKILMKFLLKDVFVPKNDHIIRTKGQQHRGPLELIIPDCRSNFDLSER